MRVVVGGLFHETNTFLDGVANLDSFTEHEGDRLVNLSGDGSPLDGVLRAAARIGWEILPAVDLRATPGPAVADLVVHRFLNQVEAVVRREQPKGIDAILLVLHGAMVSESYEDVEGEVLTRLREIAGPGPRVAAVLDLHANCTPCMAAAADLLLAYRKNPHTDGRETGTLAVELMDRILREDLTTACVLRNVPILWPPTGTGTADSPMADLELASREIESEDPCVLAMNVLAGFAFSDVEWAGVSFCCVTSGSQADAELHLDTLEQIAWNLKDRGNRVEQDLETALDSLSSRETGPNLLIEPADNIGAGTSGRGLAVLAGFLKRDISRAAVTINAPEQVAELSGASVGSRVELQLTDPFSREFLTLVGILESKSDGRFVLEDPQSHLASMGGSEVNMGPCAVVRAGGVQILLTSRRTPPFDLGQFRSQGIVPETLFAVGIKAAVAHSRAWDPIAVRSDWVDVPGPCSSRLQRLPYRRLRRPIFPLDPQ